MTCSYTLKRIGGSGWMDGWSISIAIDNSGPVFTWYWINTKICSNIIVV